MASKSTIHGKYCAPAVKSDGLFGLGAGSTCYSRDQLLDLARDYNRRFSDHIPLSGTKETLWKELQKRMRSCDSEWCWMEQLKTNWKNSPFLPSRPTGKYRWLNTQDIQEVLSQYEQAYPEFVSLGAVPMDFCSLAQYQVCQLDLNRIRRQGKTKVGIVFNTDPSTKPGKHWVSMFIDLSGHNPSSWSVEYFDSYGEAVLAKPIRELIKHLVSQTPELKVRLNCRSQMCTSKIQHQKANSECGVYSLHFILSRLQGKSYDQIVFGPRLTDNYINSLRRKYFRPPAGYAEHPY